MEIGHTDFHHSNRGIDCKQSSPERLGHLDTKPYFLLMSAAIDVSNDDEFDGFSPCTHSDGRPEVFPNYRPSFEDIVGGVRYVPAALLLQQVIYWVEVTSTRSLAVRYIAKAFGWSHQVTQNAKDHLLDKGFVSIEPGAGRQGADVWTVHYDRILEALREAGYDASRSDLTGHPDRSAEPNGSSFNSTERNERSNRSAEPNKEDCAIKKRKEEIDMEDGRTCEREQNSSTSNSSPSPNNGSSSDSSDESPSRVSTSSEGSPSELELFILDALQKWSLTPEEARDIVEKLQTLGLVEPDIRAYVSERSADFKWRSDPPSKPQVLRYITARQDLIDRGYLQPLESTRRRRERKQSPESDTQESPTSNDADQTSEPPISDDDKLAEHVLSSEVDPERREGEMQTFVEKCREYIRDGAVDEYIEGVFLFDGIEDGVVQFQTDYPFRAQNALRRYRSDLEEIAQKIWPQVEGVTCLFQGDPVEG